MSFVLRAEREEMRGLESRRKVSWSRASTVCCPGLLDDRRRGRLLGGVRSGQELVVEQWKIRICSLLRVVSTGSRAREEIGQQYSIVYE